MREGKIYKSKEGTGRLTIPKLLCEEFFGKEQQIPVYISFPERGKMVVEHIKDKEAES